MSTDIEIPEKIASIPAERFAASAHTAAEKLFTVIEPVRGWQPINFAELWKFRELIYFLAWRDVKVRYKQTALGMAWAILQPAMLMIVFTIFADQVAGLSGGELPKPLFMYLGVLPWTFFSTAISSAGNSVVGSERLVAKVYFPRLAVPIASAGAAIVDFGIALLLLGGLMAYYHFVPGATVIFTPLVFLVLAVMALGVGTMLAALNVMYRDIRYVIPFMIQICMLATPAIYKDPATYSGKLQTLHRLNPISGLIGSFRDACVGKPIDLVQLGMSALIAAALFLCGCWYFRRLERRFADVI